MINEKITEEYHLTLGLIAITQDRLQNLIARKTELEKEWQDAKKSQSE